MRERPTVTIDADNAGRRLDAFVRQLFMGVPLGAIMKWLRKGQLRVNGRRAQGNYRLAVGDVLSLPEPPNEAPAAPETRLSADAAGLVIVYEDDDLLVLNKPAGLASQPGSGQSDSLVTRVVRYLGREAAPPGKKPGLAQRLDRDVSGLVPAGKNAPALQALNRWVDEGTADKEYWALVSGRVALDRGRIDAPLRVLEHAPKNAPKVVVDPAGQRAVTHYEILERRRATTLLAVRIETGRMHQIRAHLRHQGHPIVGDPRYNAQGQSLGLTRPFLHAKRLWLPHPTRPERLELEAPLPDDLLRALDRA